MTGTSRSHWPGTDIVTGTVPAPHVEWARMHKDDHKEDICRMLRWVGVDRGTIRFDLERRKEAWTVVRI